MKKLIFVTGNADKLYEFQEYFKDKNVEIIGKKIDLPEIQSMDPFEVIKAKLLEAKVFLDYSENSSIIVEDTSLYMKALGGFPGPFAKHLLKCIKQEGLVDLASRLDTNEAEAVTIIGVADYGNIFPKMNFFDGRVNGKLIPSKNYTNYGFEDCFKPNGYEDTFTEMISKYGVNAKNKVSMRGLALNKLADYIGV